MQRKIKVACLPIAGIENPYQYLMMKGLKYDSRLDVFSGVKGKLFSFISTWIKYKPDYIHVDWLHHYYLRKYIWMTWLQFPVFVMEVLVVRFILRVKFVWTLHNIYPHDQPSFGPYQWARSFFAKNCNYIRVFSELSIERASVALNVNRKKFVVIPEGSYVEYYPNVVSGSESRKFLNLAPEKRVLLYIGNIRRYKGLELLVPVFEKINQGDWKLIIAGECRDKQYKESLQSIINSPNILLIPKYVAVEEMQYFMNSADAVILPFKKIENSGSVILAMGFKKAVIAPAIGVVKHRLAGQQHLLYDAADKDGLAKAINRLMQLSQQDLKDIGTANSKNLEFFRWQDFAGIFE